MGPTPWWSWPVSIQHLEQNTSRRGQPKAVVVVDPSRASAGAITATGELLRRARIAIRSAILIGVDPEDDESHGGLDSDWLSESESARQRRLCKHPVGDFPYVSVTSPTLALRGAKTSAEDKRLHRVWVVWALLFFNVLSYATMPTVVPIPHKVGQVLTQGALVAALSSWLSRSTRR